MKNINREGRLLQELMDRRGESNSDLARALDVSPSTVTLWLKGVRSPFATQTMLLKIASHYNVSQTTFWALRKMRLTTMN